MNLRLSSKGVRCRLSQDELARLQNEGDSLRENTVLPGGLNFSFTIVIAPSHEGSRAVTSQAPGGLDLVFALSLEWAAKLGTESLEIDGVVLEVDVFTPERRMGKDKRQEVSHV